MPTFDEFLAIDWSGANGRYAGIAVARCGPGRRAPRLLHPANSSLWTRTALTEWLVREVLRGKRLLIGFDFGFAFPYESGAAYLGGRSRGARTIFDLWNLVDARCNRAGDFGCAPFIKDPRHEGLFWTRGAKPKGWVERKRRTERACAETTGTRPESLYKLVGSKQVGKASITGMRVLRHVRQACDGAVSVWPFEEAQASVIVEIYPTLFRRRSTGSVAKIRDVQSLNRVLDKLNSHPYRSSAGKLSDHETDALVSAAGLRSIAGDPQLWRTGPSASRIAREGWIFGVPPPS